MRALEQESLPRRQTDPAWLQDHFLSTGHDKNTRNGTFTFVKRHGRHYALTCRHVMKALNNPKMVPQAEYPTIALHIDRIVLNLSRITTHGLTLGVHAPRAEIGQKEVDVAIAPLDGSYWDLLTIRKNKIAIDLDAWREPDWPSVKYCVAAGYPDEHKQNVVSDGSEKVANQLTLVVAEVTSRLGRSERLFTLSSTLELPHGYYFSGMSGGPIYAVEGYDPREVEDEELFPIGIIFEGYPASGASDMRGADLRESAFLTSRDLFVQAYMLTPEIFDEWLHEAGFKR